jgi:hypothetical protein
MTDTSWQWWSVEGVYSLMFTHSLRIPKLLSFAVTDVNTFEQKDLRTDLNGF